MCVIQYPTMNKEKCVTSTQTRRDFTLKLFEVQDCLTKTWNKDLGLFEFSEETSISLEGAYFNYSKLLSVNSTQIEKDLMLTFNIKLIKFLKDEFGWKEDTETLNILAKPSLLE